MVLPQLDLSVIMRICVFCICLWGWRPFFFSQGDYCRNWIQSRWSSWNRLHGHIDSEFVFLQWVVEVMRTVQMDWRYIFASSSSSSSSNPERPRRCARSVRGGGAQELSRLFSGQSDGLPASLERKSCCNWFLNEGSSAAPRGLGGL